VGLEGRLNEINKKKKKGESFPSGVALVSEQQGKKMSCRSCGHSHEGEKGKKGQWFWGAGGGKKRDPPQPKEEEPFTP